MELVVVNGASAISRSVIQKLASAGTYKSVRLIDQRPFRKSVYSLQKSLSGVEVEKKQFTSAASLDYALEGANEVVYFTHDYCAMSHDKNGVFEVTAKAAQKNGVQKLVGICPIEHDLYWSEDSKNPHEKKVESQQKVLSLFPNTVIVNSNLVFGRESYLLHYMTQCIIAGKIPAALDNQNGHFHYRPVHSDDLSTTVQQALSKFSDVKGHIYNLNGNKEFTLFEIARVLESATNKSNTKRSSPFLGIGVSDFIEEFFVGIAHDKNMVRMAKFHESHPKLQSHFSEQDFLAAVGQKNGVSLEEFYKNRVDDSQYVHPIFTNYKQASLD